MRAGVTVLTNELDCGVEQEGCVLRLLIIDLLIGFEDGRAIRSWLSYQIPTAMIQGGHLLLSD